jgi:hypothetical protein
MPLYFTHWISKPAATLSLGLSAVALTRAWSPSTSLPRDLQSYCEALAAKSVNAAPPLRMLTTRVDRTVTLPGSARLTLGAQWRPREKTLAVFEGSDSRLTILDSLDQVVGTVGRRGNGPAEFRLSPVYTGSRQKFRFGDGDRVLVLDDRYGHVFAGGRQIQEVQFDFAPGTLVTDAHVARMNDGWIVSTANRRAATAAERSLVRLFLVRDTAGPRQTARLLATVRNVASQAPATTGRPPALPYDDQYRRTWDAAGRNFSVVSYRHFSVCIGAADSSSWHGWSSRAVPRRVTAAERGRVLTARFGATSGPIPMMGGKVEEYYRGKWPDTAPFYYDVTALDEQTFAALRLDPEGGVTADLFDAGSGYHGSMKIPASRFVIGGYSDGLLLLNYGDGEIDFLRAVSR